MSLYTIGDLHLSFSVDKPMDRFGEVWKNHPEQLKKGFSALGDEDVCVLCGDLSWGMGLDQCREDFAFINALPGKKIILKGNHDYWWTTANKISVFFRENGFNTLSLLHNNCIFYDNVALCGTRGWFYEEEKGTEHDRKMLSREVLRLRASLDAGGEKEKLVFLHYPPLTKTYRCEEILSVLKEYHVRRCFYGHLHAKACTAAYNGWADGTEFRLISADYLHFSPKIIELYD